MKVFDYLIDRREEKLAQEDDPLRDAGPFRLGSFTPNIQSEFRSVDQMIDAVLTAVPDVEKFYESNNYERDFLLVDQNLTYQTAFPNGTNNDVVEVQLIGKVDKKRAVIIIPHWNSRRTAYHAFGRIISYFGFSVFIVTLPHHSSRGGGAEGKVANGFLNADLGVAIRSVRQSVVDARLLVGWLRQRGCEDVNLIGVSLGSCIAALVAAFDSRVRRTALLLTAGDFAETVWRGRATAHIRKQLESQISLGDLQKIWSIISPLNFVGKYSENKSEMMVLSGSRDRVVLFKLARNFVAELRNDRVKIRSYILPCGHYTLGKFPFNVVALALTTRFLTKKKIEPSP